MKFTPSTLFNSIASGASKLAKWNVYVRKVTDLSEPLDSGTAWRDVTSRIAEIPTISNLAEIESGIPTSNSISLTGLGVAWWENNIFNAAEDEYIEIKFICQLALSQTRLATDIAYMFSGFIDKPHTPGEIENTIQMNAYTLDDLLGRFPGEYLCMQTLNNNVDGIGTAGLFLITTPGVYITNANITNYVLKRGTHTISFQASNPKQAKLDDGDYVPLNYGGVTTLSNKITDELTGVSEIDQQVSVFYDDTIGLSSDATQNIIVRNAGDTLPYIWYQGASIRQTLTALFSLIGITGSNVNIGQIKFNTYDGRKTKSWYGIPPGDGTFHAQVRAISYDNSTTHKLWLGIGNQLYTFDHDTETYTLMTTFASGWTIEKIWADPSSSQGTIVGIVSDNGNAINANKEVFVYNIASTNVTVTAITCGYLQTIAYDNTNYIFLYLNTFVGGSSIKKFAIATSTESTYYTPSQPLDNTSAGFTDGSRYFGFSWVGGSKGLFIINSATTGGVDAFQALTGVNGYIKDGIVNKSYTKFYFYLPRSKNLFAYNYSS